jgi:hypothetical protein
VPPPLVRGEEGIIILYIIRIKKWAEGHPWMGCAGGDGSKALKKGLANDRSNREVKSGLLKKNLFYNKDKYE